jgi:hypothetical protein
LHFAAGFFGVQKYQSEYHQLITVEGMGFNNSLAASDSCPNANNAIGNFGSVQSQKWAMVYTKSAIDRLTPYLNGLTLTPMDIVAMQQLCAYEVRAHDIICLIIN